MPQLGVEGGILSVSKPSGEAGEADIVLGLLTSVERDSRITQRKLARDLGIALGLTNSYLRRCVRKGFIKVTQVPLRRYSYYLTPQGFAEKSRLAAAYLSSSFNFFRQARGDCVTLLSECAEQGWRRVALYGAGDFAEVAVLSAVETGIVIVCVIDAEFAGGRCGGLPVVADIAAARLMAAADGLDGLILTDTRAPQARFAELLVEAAEHDLAASRIRTPLLLGISPMAAATPAEPDAAAEIRA